MDGDNLPCGHAVCPVTEYATWDTLSAVIGITGSIGISGIIVISGIIRGVLAQAVKGTRGAFPSSDE